MADDVMTIREMCDAFDITPRALRFYEAKELLSPVRQGQKRLFTRKERARLKLILRGKRFGFSLEHIRQLLDLYEKEDNPAVQLQSTLEAYREKRKELTDQVTNLQDIMLEIDAQIEWAESELEQGSKS